jgi:hypothetical protein
MEKSDRHSEQVDQPKPGKLTIKLDEQQLRQLCVEMSKRFEAYRAQLRTTMKG